MATASLELEVSSKKLRHKKHDESDTPSKPDNSSVKKLAGKKLVKEKLRMFENVKSNEIEGIGNSAENLTSSSHFKLVNENTLVDEVTAQKKIVKKSSKHRSQENILSPDSPQPEIVEKSKTSNARRRSKSIDGKREVKNLVDQFQKLSGNEMLPGEPDLKAVTTKPREVKYTEVVVQKGAKNKIISSNENKDVSTKDVVYTEITKTTGKVKTPVNDDRVLTATASNIGSNAPPRPPPKPPKPFFDDCYQTTSNKNELHKNELLSHIHKGSKKVKDKSSGKRKSANFDACKEVQELNSSDLYNTSAKGSALYGSNEDLDKQVPVAEKVQRERTENRSSYSMKKSRSVELVYAEPCVEPVTEITAVEEEIYFVKNAIYSEPFESTHTTDLHAENGAVEFDEKGYAIPSGGERSNLSNKVWLSDVVNVLVVKNIYEA